MSGRLSFVRGLALALLFLVWAAPAQAGPSCPAEGFVQSAAKAFTSAARAGTPGAFLNATNRFASSRAIASSALGSYRGKLGRHEGEYYKLADRYIGKFMLRYSRGLNTGGLKIVSCKGNQVVATSATGNRIIFRVAGGGGHYSMADVNVQGIWLVGILRATFVGIIRNNGDDIGALMSFLRGY